MRTLILRWATIVIAVFLVAWGLPQLGIFGSEPVLDYGNDWTTLAIFAAVLALLNTFIRPILVLLTIPISCLTLGIFSLLINVITFAIAAWLVPNFYVSGFWGAVIGALAIALVGVLVNMLTGDKVG